MHWWMIAVNSVVAPQGRGLVQPTLQRCLCNVWFCWCDGWCCFCIMCGAWPFNSSTHALGCVYVTCMQIQLFWGRSEQFISTHCGLLSFPSIPASFAFTTTFSSTSSSLTFCNFRLQTLITGYTKRFVWQCWYRMACTVTFHLLLGSPLFKWTWMKRRGSVRYIFLHEPAQIHSATSNWGKPEGALHWQWYLEGRLYVTIHGAQLGSVYTQLLNLNRNCACSV